MLAEESMLRLIKSRSLLSFVMSMNKKKCNYVCVSKTVDFCLLYSESITMIITLIATSTSDKI